MIQITNFIEMSDEEYSSFFAFNELDVLSRKALIAHGLNRISDSHYGIAFMGESLEGKKLLIEHGLDKISDDTYSIDFAYKTASMEEKRLLIEHGINKISDNAYTFRTLDLLKTGDWANFAWMLEQFPNKIPYYGYQAILSNEIWDLYVSNPFDSDNIENALNETNFSQNYNIVLRLYDQKQKECSGFINNADFIKNNLFSASGLPPVIYLRENNKPIYLSEDRHWMEDRIDELVEHKLIKQILSAVSTEPIPVNFGAFLGIGVAGGYQFYPNSLEGSMVTIRDWDEGILTHEITHYLMNKVFKNNTNPYKQYDSASEELFDKVIHDVLDNFITSYYGIKNLSNIVQLIPDYFSLGSYNKGKMIGNLTFDESNCDIYTQFFSEKSNFYQQCAGVNDVSENAPLPEDIVKSVVDNFLLIYTDYPEYAEHGEFIVRYPEAVANKHYDNSATVQQMLNPLSWYWDRVIIPAIEDEIDLMGVC